jgi:hypothetical protein
MAGGEGKEVETVGTNACSSVQCPSGVSPPIGRIPCITSGYQIPCTPPIDISPVEDGKEDVHSPVMYVPIYNPAAYMHSMNQPAGTPMGLPSFPTYKTEEEVKQFMKSNKVAALGPPARAN